MKTKIITATLAALVATASIGTASAADAQSRGRGPVHAAPAHAQQAPARARPAPAAQNYGRWQRAQNRYNAGRYQAPRGYQARQWAYGQRMPVQYRTRSYVVSDYQRYGLRTPPRGYEYVRSGNDVVLAAVATGVIAAVIASLFN